MKSTYRTIALRRPEASLRLRLRTPAEGALEPEDPAEVPAWVATLTAGEVPARRRPRRRAGRTEGR